MKAASFAIAALIGLVMLGSSPSQAIAADVPFYTGRVVDDAEILSAAARQQLSATIKAHEDKTTNQIAVLTIASLDGESVEDYANKVFQAWKLGIKGKDNGVLL